MFARMRTRYQKRLQQADRERSPPTPRSQASGQLGRGPAVRGRDAQPYKRCTGTATSSKTFGLTETHNRHERTRGGCCSRLGDPIPKRALMHTKIPGELADRLPVSIICAS